MNAIQIAADQEEERSIRTYDLWQSWAREQALANIERHLRGEAVRSEEEWSSNGGHSRLPFASRRDWVGVIGAAVVVALALFIWLLSRLPGQAWAVTRG